MPPRLVIFDLDSTIITCDRSTAEQWLVTCRETCADGDPDPAVIAAAIREAGEWYWRDEGRHRDGRLRLFAARRAVARLAFEKLGLDRPELADRIADRYSRAREDTARLADGALDTLDAFRAAGTRLAMLTNGGSDLQRAKIDRFRLEPYFEVIVIEGEFGVGKPEPGGFLHILKVLDTAADGSWMVGDDLKRDIVPAHGLGLRTVWVDERGGGLPSSPAVRPDRIVRGIGGLEL